ncbi:MAG: hypothetical protein ACOVLB_04930 [Candidatus Nanopelagicus sp.]
MAMRMTVEKREKDWIVHLAYVNNGSDWYKHQLEFEYEIQQWVIANTTNYLIDPTMWKIYFKNEKDAVAFLLRWQ